MTISILLSFYRHVLPHIVMAFFNILHSFRVCVHARVFVNAYESGRNYIHSCNKKLFEGIRLVENEPPCGESWLRACFADNVLVFKRAMLKGPSEGKSGQCDVTTKSTTTAMLVTALFEIKGGGGLQPPQPPLWIRHCDIANIECLACTESLQSRN